MSTTITHDAGTITPKVVNGFEASRPVRSKVHDILGSSNSDVTFRPAGLRRGTLTLVFATGAEAAAAEAVLATPQVFLLVEPDVVEVEMSFVVAGGDLRPRLDPGTRKTWLVDVPFVEVSP